MIQYHEKAAAWVIMEGKKIIARSKDRSKLEAKYPEYAKSGSVTMAMPKSEFSVAERFEFIEEFTKLVARNVIPSLVVTGSGGLGKTFTVTATLKAIGKTEENNETHMISGFSTPRALYETLYEHNGKIIIFDDCDSVFKDPIGANLLKAALDSKEKRIISWGASGKDDAIPNRFEFYGKVIFISNLSIDKFPQAVLSRSMLADISLNMEEKIERIGQIFATERAYEAEDKREVMAFIHRNADKFKDLNIRSAMNTLKMKVAVGEKWERMAMYQAVLN